MAVVKKKQVSKRWTRLKDEYNGTYYILSMVLDKEAYPVAQIKRESAFNSASPWYIDCLGGEFVARAGTSKDVDYLAYATLERAKAVTEQLFKDFVRSKK